MCRDRETGIYKVRAQTNVQYNSPLRPVDQNKDWPSDSSNSSCARRSRTWSGNRDISKSIGYTWAIEAIDHRCLNDTKISQILLHLLEKQYYFTTNISRTQHPDATTTTIAQWERDDSSRLLSLSLGTALTVHHYYYLHTHSLSIDKMHRSPSASWDGRLKTTQFHSLPNSGYLRAKFKRCLSLNICYCWLEWKSTKCSDTCNQSSRPFCRLTRCVCLATCLDHTATYICYSFTLITPSCIVSSHFTD
jgi:hypothetical protein